MPRIISSPTKTSRTLKSRFDAVESPHRVAKPEVPIVLEELMDKIPQDWQLYASYTNPVGWSVVLVDKVLGTIVSHEEAQPRLIDALKEAFVATGRYAKA